jgi:Fic family protein
VHVPLTPPPFPELLSKIDLDRIVPLMARRDLEPSDEYLHWDRLLHLLPPEGLTTEEWWTAIKLGRAQGKRTIALLDTSGRPFSFNNPDLVLERLHRIDQQASGNIAMSESITTPGVRDRYVLTSLIEEAITSSQLEGATTSRRVAKDMLRSGRDPRNRDERMIFNNFQAMQEIRRTCASPLTAEAVCNLHRLVTAGTLDDPTAAGRLEGPGEERVRIWGDGDQLLHTPPAASELPERLERLCEFANGGTDHGFVHPVVRAVVLHFWVGYDHYFADGNGRTARAIFYWSMLREGYWMAEFLTISSILRKAPISYAQSFLRTETDDNDLTYFVIDQLDVLLRAIEGLQQYLARKAREVRDVELLMRGGAGLNHRQRALLGDALRNTGSRYTIEGHRRSHAVVYQTARADLLDLVGRNLLDQHREGKAFVFTVAPGLTERLTSLANY